MSNEKAPPPGNLPGVPEEEPKEEQTSQKNNEEEKESDSKNEVDEKSLIEKNRNRDFLIVAIVFVAIAGLYIFSILISGPEESGKLTITESQKETLTGRLQPSIYRGWITLESGTAGEAIYPGREYVKISINRDNLSYLYISDWTLVTPYGERIPLGQAAYVPLRGEVNDTNEIIVNAGDTLIVNSGGSPIGVSFRQNACTGYFEQFQNFSPPIPRKCPGFEDRVEEIGGACAVYVSQKPECEAVVEPLPDYLSVRCTAFIQSEITYNSCVETFRGSPGFKGNIWRIYLGKEEQVWPASGTITLLDSKGRVVDQVKY